jgi:hypothetical protein
MNSAVFICEIRFRSYRSVLLQKSSPNRANFVICKSEIGKTRSMHGKKGKVVPVLN